jgi:hypothetical protein
MSEEVVEKPFRLAAEHVEEAHQQSVEDLRAKVAKAKAEALEKISS